MLCKAKVSSFKGLFTVSMCQHMMVEINLVKFRTYKRFITGIVCFLIIWQLRLAWLLFIFIRTQTAWVIPPLRSTQTTNWPVGPEYVLRGFNFKTGGSRTISDLEIVKKTWFRLKNDNSVLVWQTVKHYLYWGHYTEAKVWNSKSNL